MPERPDASGGATHPGWAVISPENMEKATAILSPHKGENMTQAEVGELALMTLSNQFRMPKHRDRFTALVQKIGTEEVRSRLLDLMSGTAYSEP